ncbi:hypothetical protein GPECTOR_1g1 [Gonium pectorale]|uniref:Uncharacterized protein n=1 Tax=Gonium pectorale TaxID=33097 RepID=A0A150H2Q5_GONPE|nr:hypothetical protein GPECTOR_1g1 [Gonium pectorale]|eukprot:KXZ56118.1 hypothetical protein GPECTOR_1g1 [Gonium pectorale]
MRPSAFSVASRANSGTGGKPSGGILHDFQSSLLQEEERALAAVDAEFDRRFGRGSTPVPYGPVDPEALSRQLQQLQNQSNQNTISPAHSQIPRPPSAERSVPPPGGRRRSLFSNAANGNSNGGAPVNGGGGGMVGSPDLHHYPMNQRLARASCSAALMTNAGEAGASQESMLISSFDATTSPPTLNPKMRLASIRLSYADGIVGPGVAPASSGEVAVDGVVADVGSERNSPGRAPKAEVPHRDPPRPEDPMSRGTSGPQPPVMMLPPGVSPRRRSAEIFVRPAMST